MLTVVFDGINQQPSAPWIRLLQILQGPVFGGRVRVVLTSREHFVHDRMGSFRRLSPPPTVVRVDIYDDAPGGEFDQVLALEGLRRSDLRPDLLELARTPRLFKLVTLLRHRLGDVQAVTVPRLLWEYGRDSLGVRAGAEFGEVDWQEWVRDVARTCRSGMPRFSTRELSDSASRSDLSPEAIYRRLSELVDGHFVRQSRSGDWEPSQPFVSLALAVTLTAHLEDMAEQSPQAIAAALAEWLEPISGMDQRADVLRAASTIAVARGASCSAALRSELVVAWVLSHNLPEEHLSELLSIVRGEPDLLLDIAEGTRSDDRTPARKWALRTLRTASTADHRVQRAIVNRVAAWCRRISRGVDRVRSLDAQYAEARLKQLGSRVGSTAVGPRDILSVRCTLVDDPDRLLMSYAPSLLESCPLDECGPVFEAAAIELAVRGECDQWEELKWLCWFNERRPDQAATMLRHLAADIRRRTPEPGVHPQLPEAVASNLLLLSGVETDERLAAGITPDFARPFNYATDYEADPARSMFALERRHAVAVLGKSDIPLHARVQRLGDLWYDPTFLPPASFATELVDAVSSLALNNVDCHNGVTSEDHWLETVEPALARVAPDALATLAQKVFQQSLAQPKANAYWRAVRAAEPLVLVDQTAVSVAASLRDGGFGMSDGSELHAATELLLLELVQLGAREQHRRLVLSNLPAIYTRFEHILKPLTEEDVDALISEFRFGSPKQHQDLLDLLSLQNVPLSEVAWMWLSEQKDHQNPNVRGRVFQHLADSNAVRFGAILRESGWSWDQGSHLFVNHYGSVALIAASMGLAFDLIAPRLAPWKVLFAARQRGEKSEEVRLAAAILDHVLMRPSGDGSDPGVELEVHCTDLQSPSILVSVATPDGEGDNPIAALEAALNPEARQQAYQRALRAAVKHIQRTQRSGHSLYLINYQQADMDVVARIAPDVVDRWLRGMEECTPEFRERVWLAERVYLALAASLLQHNPARGVAAWRALRVALRTRYIGEAGIDELIHMVFQAAESEDVAHLRRELLDPSSCNTDQDLQDIAIAAMLHGKREWLESVMREDAASNVVWRQRRAVVLEGYTTGHTLPVERAWPRCGLATSYERLAQRAACRKSNDACARHWWRQYIGAETPAAAYAAWVLFTRSADRRRRLWMTADSREARKSKEIPHLTSAHLELNSEKLKRAVAKRERNREKQFLGRDISKHIKPWRSDD
ncbi:MAG TPA: hypothetical protein VHN77_14710 [Phycisphaerales bacterium]|nr:hypothetical protein [Phycisphaerales bacterium]